MCIRTAWKELPEPFPETRILSCTVSKQNTQIFSGFSMRNSGFYSEFVFTFSLVMSSLWNHLSHESWSGARFVFPVWRQDGLDLVVAGQTVDSWLDQNQTEFAVDVLTVALQMLADAHGTLDQIVEVLWDVWLQSDGFHDSENLVAVDETHLGDSVRIAENDT